MSSRNERFLVVLPNQPRGELLFQADRQLGLCLQEVVLLSGDEGLVIHQQGRPRRNDLTQPKEGWRTLCRVGESEGDSEGGSGSGVVCHNVEDIRLGLSFRQPESLGEANLPLLRDLEPFLVFTVPFLHFIFDPFDRTFRDESFIFQPEQLLLEFTDP